MKDLIFISHSFPPDNYAGAWLASKLKMLGYRWFLLYNFIL